MRSVVSYDDLEQITTAHAPGLPPAKKRKRQQNKRKSFGSQKFAHWDEPIENHDVSLADNDYAGDLEGETVDAEGRELTHEEIWDDSALIEAWDAAMDEYKVRQSHVSDIPLISHRHSTDQRTSGRMNRPQNLPLCEYYPMFRLVMLSPMQMVQCATLSFQHHRCGCRFEITFVHT
jgi:hypothetical protein